MDAIFDASSMTEPIPHDLPDEDLAESLVAEATRGFEGTVSARELAAIRDELVDRLLVTKAGQELLRQVRPDPSVSASGDVVAPGVSRQELDAFIAKAMDGANKNGTR